MRTGKICSLTAVIMCALSLSGCSIPGINNTWEPEETSLRVKKDGTLTETVIDQLDADYYNSTELEQMIQSSVSEYNQSHGTDTVGIEELLLENNQVKLTMNYKSAQDYAEYNNVKFYNGSMLGAEMDGYLFYNTFKSVEDGQITGEDLSNEEPLKHKEYQVLITDLSHAVRVPGDVAYVSSNGYPVDKKDVKPSTDKITVQQEDQGLVLPSNAVYVPEEDNGPVTVKDLEKTYLYIIYEF